MAASLRRTHKPWDSAEPVKCSEMRYFITVPLGTFWLKLQYLFWKQKVRRESVTTLSSNISKLDDKKMVICKVISCLILQFYFWWRIQLQVLLLSEASVIRKFFKHLSSVDYLLLERCCHIRPYNTHPQLQLWHVLSMMYFPPSARAALVLLHLSQTG